MYVVDRCLEQACWLPCVSASIVKDWDAEARNAVIIGEAHVVMEHRETGVSVTRSGRLASIY